MKLIFLCGSLEPGRDGVGDYTRRLAAELIRQGHQAVLIALQDHAAVETIAHGIQESDGVPVPVLRISAAMPAPERFAEAAGYITTYNPDWISLQYVSFSFNDKGLPFGLSRYINQLTRGRKLHIMFHELWVGMNKEATWKLVCWGWLQRIMISIFIKQIKPLFVHTHTKLYQLQLKKLGINAVLLPLFSNIKVMNTARQTKKEADEVQFVVFGVIYPGAPINDFAKEVAEYAIAHHVKFTLTFVGRCGKEQEYWADVWRSHGLAATILGELPEEQISLELSKATIGIANTPYYLLDKSGANAALKAHGLPVICVSHNWTARGIPKDTNNKKTPQYRVGNLGHLLNTTAEYSRPDLSVIASSFITSLQVKPHLTISVES